MVHMNLAVFIASWDSPCEQRDKDEYTAARFDRPSPEEASPLSDGPRRGCDKPFSCQLFTS